MTKRIFMAALATETNTFAPIPTGWRAFEEGGLARGDASGHPDWMIGVLPAEWRRLAEADGYTFIEGTSAAAGPSGLTLRSVYESLRDEILDQLRAAMPVDIVLLALHGAMVADGYDDCEGDLLANVREIVGPDVVIGAELDLHCHASEAMFRAADAIIAFKEYPHIDELDRGRELYAICRDTALAKVKPVTGVFDCRMISMWRTTEDPMRGFVADMQEAEQQEGVLSMSFGHGFPWGDVADVGAKMWVITDGDQALADRLAREWGHRIYGLRNETQTQVLSVDQALDRASETQGCVVLADVADNPGGGAPCDSTFILRAMLERGIASAVLGCLYDPVAVLLCKDAGVGARLALRVGGKIGPASGDPVDLDVLVRAVEPDHWQTGLGGDIVRFGPSVWIEAHGLNLVLVSRREQVLSVDAFTNIGLDPFARPLVVVKSTQHFYNSFAPYAQAVHYVSTPGAIAPDFASIAFTKRDGNYWPRKPDPLGIGN